MTGQRVTGLILVLVGTVLLLTTYTDLDARVILPTIGIAFLLAHLLTGRYGYLVPGGIITGLGVGVVLESQGFGTSLPLLGLGVGFLAIGLVDRLTGGTGSGWWWPFIPGGILTTVGLATVPGGRDVLAVAGPAVLILIGLALVVGRRPGRRRDASPGGEGDRPATD